MQRKWYLEGADALVWRVENMMTDKKEDLVNMDYDETSVSLDVDREEKRRSFTGIRPPRFLEFVVCRLQLNESPRLRSWSQFAFLGTRVCFRSHKSTC